MWQSIVNWFKARGGFAHVVAAAWAGAVTLYATVPPFHNFITTVYTSLPAKLGETIVAAVGLAAWYFSSGKANPTPNPDTPPVHRNGTP